MSIDTPTQPTVTTLDAIVSRDDLLDALTFVSVAVSTRAPVPILSGVRIQAYNHQITLNTTDFETWATQEVSAPGATGHVVLPHAALVKIMKSLPREARTVTIKADDTRATISDGTTTFKVPVLPLDAFPERPHMGSHRLLSMSGTAFHTMVTKVACAASRDDTLPVLKQVCFRVGLDVNVYATDRYRLTSYTVNQAPENLTRSPMVPAKLLTTLAGHFKTSRLLSVWTDEVHRDIASSTGYYTTFTDGARSATIREVEGEFPSVERLFPDQTFTHVDLDAADVLKALKQVDVAVERNTPVTFDLSDDPVLLKAGSEGLTAERPLTATIERTNPATPVDRVAFTPSFLTDAIKTCGDKPRMSISVETKPVLFTDPGDPAYRYLLVPIRIAR